MMRTDRFQFSGERSVIAYELDVMDVDEDIHRMALPTPFDVGTVNGYLLRMDPLTLIDPGPGMEPAWEALQAGLDRLGFSLEDVERILVTHPHLDHFGLAGRVRSASGATLRVHPRAKDDFNDYVRRYRRDRDFFGPFLESMGMPEQVVSVVNSLPESFTDLAEPTEVDGLVQPDDLLEGDLDLIALDSPGHCAGSYTYWCPERDLAFTGDHVLKEISPNALLQVRDGQRRHSLLRYLEALESLREQIGDRTVRGLTGHGDVVGDLSRRIDELIRHHEKRRETFYGMLEDGMTAYDLMEEAFPDLPAREYFLGMSEIIGHLDMLVEESRVTTEERDGRVTYRHTA